MKRVWFVSHYSMPPKYEMRIKTQMYAHYLQKKGFECTIFSASTIHNTSINLIEDNSDYIERVYDDLHFVHIKTSNYSGNGIKRIINMRQFATRFNKIAKRFEKPDVVVADANCLNYGPIYSYCKKMGIPIYIDMRDLWPMSIVEYYKYSEKNPIIQYMYHLEHKMYKKVTGVIFSMPGGKDYIRDKKWLDLDLDKFYYINNGVDLEQFAKQIKENAFSDIDLDSDSFKVVYAGSIRTANNLISIVKAAELIKEPKIKFLLYGEGDDKSSLIEYCKEHGINNVVFKGQVEKKLIPYILSKCDLSILNYKKAKTLKYGGSQNKLFEYLASGCPVLVTIDMNYNIVKDCNCGIALEEPDSKLIADAILKMYNMPLEERENMSKNAMEVAKEYDFEILTNKLLTIIGGQKNG
ncbi:MAG TPA: glycosyltransferase family 4 protein [Fervidobacterium sp.]|nr:glycosyltransferase family 4 protein [Fervidobacterium sp.]